MCQEWAALLTISRPSDLASFVTNMQEVHTLHRPRVNYPVLVPLEFSDYSYLGGGLSYLVEI